jgi:DNA-binding transcriptional LysR family regulator
MPARDYRLLAYFVEIVEAGSLTAASRRLSLSPPVLSAALSDLEAIAGTSLLRRGRKGAVPTREGAVLYESASAMVAAAQTAMAGFAARRAAPAGEVRVSLPTELALAWLPQHLRAFERRHPAIAVRLDATDLPIDFTQTDCDVALRARHGFGTSTSPDVLVQLPVELIAAPALLADLPRNVPARLAELPLIALSSGANPGLYVGRARNGDMLRVAARVRMVVNNGYVAKEFARLGFGAALAIGVSVASDLKAGRLVRVAPNLDFGHVALRALFRDPRPSPAATAFVTFLAGRMAKKLRI